MEKLRSLILLISTMVMFLFLTGCVGVALMAVQPVITGAYVANRVHNATASTTLKFIEEEQKGKVDFEKLAIWPDNKCEVYLADNLQSRGYSVVSPSQIGRVIQEIGLEKNLDNLTQTEMLQTLQRVCKKTGADSVFGAKANQIIIYSFATNRVMWSAKIQVAHKKNSSQNDLSKQIANLLADKIVALNIKGTTLAGK